MMQTFEYISIKEILSRCLRHPLLKNLNLEDAIYYTIDFIRLVGLPQIYTDRIATIKIEDYRALLPCDCIKVTQIKNQDDVVLRSMISSFNQHDNNMAVSYPAYKLQGNVLYTNFPEGELLLSYQAIKIDDDGLPMLPDNPAFIKALECYIKKEYFTILFDTGKISLKVMENTQADWAFAVAKCRAEFLIPSIDEMETIGSIIKRLLPPRNMHNTGFTTAHNPEIFKNKNPRSE